MQRRIEPPRFSIPYFEYLVEHPALVMQQEYTVHQSIGPMAALALYLNAQ
jgi:endoglucanase